MTQSTRPPNQFATLLPPEDLVPPLITVLGEVIPKKEYHERRLALPTGFMVEHPAKVRSLVDQITKLTNEDIERDTQAAHSLLEDSYERAKAAFEVLAWNFIVNPYYHPKRQYWMNTDPYTKLIETEAQYTYMFAMMIIKKPSDYAYEKLRQLHAETAKVYRDYCRNYAIAEFEYQDLYWMFNY